jgi:ATP-dependent DNA ligase
VPGDGAESADFEGIVAKRLADAYQPKLAQWHKIRAIRSIAAAPNGFASAAGRADKVR